MYNHGGFGDHSKSGNRLPGQGRATSDHSKEGAGQQMTRARRATGDQSKGGQLVTRAVGNGGYVSRFAERPRARGIRNARTHNHEYLIFSCGAAFAIFALRCSCASLFTLSNFVVYLLCIVCLIMEASVIEAQVGTGDHSLERQPVTKARGGNR